MLVTTSAVKWRGALCFPMAALIAWAYGQYIMVGVLTVLEMTDRGGVTAVFVCFLVCYFFSHTVCTYPLADANMQNLDVRGCSYRLTSAIQHQFGQHDLLF